jgi:hypothetical protein
MIRIIAIDLLHDRDNCNLAIASSMVSNFAEQGGFNFITFQIPHEIILGYEWLAS